MTLLLPKSERQPRHFLRGVDRVGGWLPDKPKIEQDWRISRKLGSAPQAMPDSPTLNPTFFPEIRDQGNLGSCTGFGCRTALATKFREKHGERLLKNGPWGKQWDLSPLALYFWARLIENCVDEDSGAYIRDVVDGARRYGAPTENSWSYITTKFKREPNETAKKTAKWHQADISTYRCDDIGMSGEQTATNVVRALDAGYPVIFGFTCFDNLSEADLSGFIPMPLAKSKDIGGHCMCILKADTRARVFSGHNSWSEDWGDKGWFHLPFGYFEKGYADDAWAMAIE